MQINNVVIAGRPTKPIEYSATRNGIPAAKFTLANTRGKHTNYVPVVAFNKTADYAKDYIHKGQRLTVQGVLNHHTTQSNGTYHDYWSIIASTFDPIHQTKQSRSVKDLYAKFDEISKKVDKASQSGKRTKKHARKRKKTTRK